ncbi:hypothetical protein HHI36_018753 [Cryptolaemus montrouzieri]|uniref:Rac GTPase-activating protein 1 n=1 Tax=Cryptolaemus montrouzieri TaxID=559131 RepID=A0ABD2P0V1_9CUCU
MADSIFKTPYKYGTPKVSKHDKFYTPIKSRSDSEESLVSTASDSGTSDSQLSIIAEFDEISRFEKTLKSQYTHLEKSYAEFVENTRMLYESFLKSRDECLKLQHRLDVMARDNCDLEDKLTIARKLLDKEKKNTKSAERERDNLEMQIHQVKELFIRDRDARRVIPEDTLSKFAFMETDRIDQEQAPHLSCIPEVNSTGSILSDFSYSKSEDDLDTSKFHTGKSWKKHGPTTDAVPEQPALKKRRSSGNKIVEISTTDTVRATTTLSMPKHGPITATSVIEAVPMPSAPPLSNHYAPSAPPPDTPQSMRTIEHEPSLPADVIFQSWARKEGPPKPSRAKFDGREKQEMNNNYYSQKQHAFQKKTVVIPDTCSICQKKLKFGRPAWKCKECKNICHEECKDKLPTPCIPVIHTPNQRNGLGVVGDYTGTTPPMVPALIIHCINEIELRDQKEVGLYRVPGSEKDVKTLKEKFLRGKAAPCLNDVDVHVLCGVVKDFLRSLQEPLLTKIHRNDFVRSCDSNDTQMMMDIILELPQPNRDTLAYMMLHLQRIAEKKDIKMPVDNLAKIFGPTIVGYSSEDIDREILIMETKQQFNIMKTLFTFPSSYWESFVNVNSLHTNTRLQQTPSTDSLLFKVSKTPIRCAASASKKRRFFPTPPLQ